MAASSTTFDSIPLSKGVFGGLAALLLMLFFPAFAAVLAFLLMGWTMIRSALNHRQSGWVSGLLFGLILLLAPVGGWLYAILFSFAQ